ncbi:MAG: hypothetical protein KIPDCIKN_02560 [Haliscomenobacter sp.]|jgi:hypothetical protein|nr:hypothetical protein [Haliscomenobacter sp.]
MKFVRFTFFLFLGLLTGFSSQAQERYLKEIFTGVTVTPSITYGNNISVLTGAPVPTDLKMDVYAPAGDTLKNRAAILYFHTGSFLPPLYNGGITGDRKDSTTVEICKRLARMGYVVFNATYRLGWNPAATGADGQDIRTGTLLNAAYRGIQDGRTLVRFLRKSVAEESNKYGIDPNRIAAWGQGTGGYISMGMAFLDRFQEEVVLEKFIGKDLKPYVDTTLNGNLYATTTTPLCLANHPGYSSDIKAAINMGGAIGDINWLEGKPGEPVIVGFHVVSDPFAPFADGPVIVPTTGDFVVNVSGTYSVVKKANDLGTNAPIADANSDLTNPFNAVNKVLSQVPIDYRGQAIKLSTDNMFPFVLPGFQSGPWEWWDKATLDLVVAGANAALGTNFNADTLHRNGLLTNPDMSKAKGMAYIDTIMGISLPRLYLALNLATSTKQLLKAEDVELKIAPNPVSDMAYFRSSPDHVMRDIAIYSMDGRLMTGAINLNTNYYELYRGKLPPGIYVAQVRFDHGIVASKIVVQ